MPLFASSAAAHNPPMPLPMTMTSFVVSADVDVDADAAAVVVGLVAVALVPRGARGVVAERDARMGVVDEWRHNRAHVAVVDATAADGRLASRARRTTRVRSLERAREGADGIARACVASSGRERISSTPWSDEDIGSSRCSRCC